MTKFAFLALAVVAMTGSAFAQDNATATVTGTVQYEVEITKVDDISFGTDLERGVTATVAPTSGDAAKFYVTGDSKDKVFFNIPTTVTMNLVPAGAGQLAGIVADGTQEVTLVWNTSATIRHLDDAATSISINPNPHELSTAGVNDGGAYGVSSGIGQMYVYVGGSVTPNANQQRGAYTGDIVVGVDYAN